MLKILYIPSLNIPVCYWRVENYAMRMVDLKKDVAVNVEYFTDILDIKMAWDDACVGKGDISKEIQTKLRNAFKFFNIIIFQRIQNMPALALIEKLRGEYPSVKIVAELDDSIYEVPLSSPYQWSDQHRWSVEHLHRSDAVICSTEYLKNSVLEVIGEKPVHVAPNCINTKIWNPTGAKKYLRHRESNVYRIGYVGGAAHDEDLRIVYKSILPIIRKHIKFIIRYGGYRPKWLKDHPDIDFKSVAWSMDEYPQQLVNMNIDLALAPLRDSEFNRCKSNLKWIEWSSLNIPLLASNVEPYKKTNGTIFLTENHVEEWRGNIKLFVEGGNHRTGEKFNLRSESLRNYDIKKETRKLVSFLKDIINN
jgi:hypothetical protein